MTAPTLLMLETPRDILNDVEPTGSGAFQFVHWTEECYPDTTAVSGIQIWERTMFDTLEELRRHDDEYCNMGMYGDPDHVSILNESGNVLTDEQQQEIQGIAVKHTHPVGADYDSSLPLPF